MRGRKGTLDEAVFDAADPSPDASYYAGLLLADGCVHSGSVRLKLSGEDGAHVYRFREFLRASNAVRRIRLPLPAQDQYELSVGSRRLAAALERFGVVPNKTIVACVPAFLEDNPHWWRGVVDGDGWIEARKRADGKCKTPSIGLCGTKAVVTSFAEYVRRLTGKANAVRLNGKTGVCWRTTVGGRAGLTVVRHLYDCGGVALPRKAEKAAELMELYSHEAESSARERLQRKDFSYPARRPFFNTQKNTWAYKTNQGLPDRIVSLGVRGRENEAAADEMLTMVLAVGLPPRGRHINHDLVRRQYAAIQCASQA